MSDSKTPMTDAFEKDDRESWEMSREIGDPPYGSQGALEFARTLEMKLAAANARVSAMEADAKASSAALEAMRLSYPDELARLSNERDAARAALKFTAEQLRCYTDVHGADEDDEQAFALCEDALRDSQNAANGDDAARDALQIAFVEGADWWERDRVNAPMLTEDRNSAKKESKRRLDDGTLGKVKDPK